jgi:hypothetical protein
VIQHFSVRLSIIRKFKNFHLILLDAPAPGSRHADDAVRCCWRSARDWCRQNAYEYSKGALWQRLQTLTAAIIELPASWTSLP